MLAGKDGSFWQGHFLRRVKRHCKDITVSSLQGHYSFKGSLISLPRSVLA